MRKVFCQGYTRAGRREGKLIPCRMKGYQLANGTFYCKYHGYQNVKGFRKANYTDETRIKQLSNERSNTYRNLRGKTVRVQLDEVLCSLKEKSRAKRENN